MAQYELLLPKMGESVTEATIIKWTKNPGDVIREDDSVLEIATDKVDSEVPSPVSGKLVKQLFAENDVAQVGDVIAIIETAGQGGSEQEEVAVKAEKAVEEAQAVPQASIAQDIPGLSQLEKETPVENTSESQRFYSPLVRSIAAEENIAISELDKIQGTGTEGRVTKQDILEYLKTRSGSVAPQQQEEPKQAPKAQVQQPSAQRSEPVKPVTSVSGGDEIIEMDRMRKLIAEHMVNSKQTSPHVTSFVEADVTNMVKWRERVKNSFEKREGGKITFTPIFIEAVAKAIKDLPMINVSVNGTQIIKKRDINIGMATALPSGNLIVPVIKSADQLNLVGLTKAVNDLANRARNNKLQPDEVKDGTFTITNVGSFGNVMGTPIINQPQVAILAVGAIKKKPAVIETEFGDMIGIRHMMFLSLSYDHRVVDGALGGSFVRKVADYLESWDFNREI
ncbi:MAG: diapophytoene dehydrogenase [Sphingobacteriaceae bacterium]|jgi:2-oxoglutarate dehydrogenase E2 component (dihydrolipoamide succinyltransferase)|nr:diapophytoene dehydrogenase [Sphingobacteriaceae bacterium]